SLDALRWLDVKGFSVTIPHKEAIIPLLNRVDKSVELTGSCNTVVRDGAEWVGHNTDYRAAMETLEEAMGGVVGDTSPRLDKQVLVLGAGGVARSIAFGLARRGAGVTICGRSEDKANRLAEEAGCRSVSWSMRAGTLHDILINCTPVGMHPDVDE